MPHKILVVDDEHSIREIIRDLLLEAGYDVSLAVDGMDALEQIQYTKFDLYILDVFMPRMNGLELLAKIKEIQPLAVVVVSTGHSDTDVAIKAVRAGAFHYLTKPIQVEELLKVVTSGLDHSRSLEEPVSGAADEGKIQYSQLLLRGFSHEQAREFIAIGNFASYKSGELISQEENPGPMIRVESGRVAVFYNHSQIDILESGRYWGEEIFIYPGAKFTKLIAQEDTQIRHYPRRRLLEYFTYQDETLTKKYMINLIQSMYLKWKQTVLMLGLYSGYNPDKHKGGE